MRFNGKSEPHFNNAEKCFGKDFHTHLALAYLSVDEGDRHFYEFKSFANGVVFHLNLEGVANKFDFIEIDGFEHFSVVAYEAGSSVFNANPQNRPHIKRSEIRN